MRVIFKFVVACATAHLAIVPLIAREPTMGERIDRAIDADLKKGLMVGTVVIVLRDGKVVYRRAAGFADVERSRRMSTDQIFRLASLSKTVTSTTAMALVDRGKLALDTPVTRWLPEFTPKTPDGATPVVTIRQLLTHMSGLSYEFIQGKNGSYQRFKVSSGLDQPGLSLDEEVRRATAAGLEFKPGSDWRYSIGLDVLGAVIAKASGMSFPQAVATYVTRPLSMRDTGFTLTDPSRLAKAYANGDTGPVVLTDDMDVPYPDGTSIRFVPSRIFDPKSFPSGGAGMVGTAPDFVRLLETIRTGGGKVVRSASVKEMLSNQVGSFATLGGPGWGFGIGGATLVDTTVAGTPQTMGTWSWSGAYGNSWFVDPAARLTVVAMGNTTPAGDGGAYAIDIRNAVYGASAVK